MKVGSRIDYLVGLGSAGNGIRSSRMIVWLTVPGREMVGCFRADSQEMPGSRVYFGRKGGE